MARLNGILTKLQGSVGSFTFKQNGGQTVVSEKITQTTNAKTNGQQKQRMKWTNVIRMYQVLTPYLKLAFGVLAMDAATTTSLSRRISARLRSISPSRRPKRGQASWLPTR